MRLQGAELGSKTTAPGRLPSYHVARPRLTDLCRDAPVVVVEASAGYGKSVLARELLNDWGVVPVEVLLEEGGVSAQLLASRLRSAVAHAGFSDTAASMAAAADDAAGAVDAMLSALAGESCAVVIDDAHHALRDAGVLIERMAERLPPSLRLVVLARRLPPGAERLRRADAEQLGAADLALRPEETVALCRSGFGLDASVEDCRAVDMATGGWTAATVLAASRARRTGQLLAQVVGPDGLGPDGLGPDGLGPDGLGPDGLGPDHRGEPLDAVGSILDELVVALGSDRELLGRVASVPLLDRELVEAVTGREGFFERAVALGLPLTPAGGGWWELPGPVREHLVIAAGQGSVGGRDPASLVRAAACYEQRGELGVALQMLLAAGEAEHAAELLASAEPRRTENLDALELLAVLGRIPDEVLDRHPRALFQVARACGVVALLQQRSALLQRLTAVVSEADDPPLRRAIEAELAVDLGNSSRPFDAFALAGAVLASTGAGENLTRARALGAMGMGACFRRDTDGSLTEDTLREAAGYLDQAIQIYLDLGYPEATAGPAIERAMRTEFGRGRLQAAMDDLDDVIARVARFPRRLGRLLFYRAQVLTELGRFDESEASLDEVMRIARQDSGGLLVALVHWERMLLASYRGEADATLEHANQVEANRGDWWVPAGAHYMAEAADCLDRVGHTAAASGYLERAQLVDPHGAERVIAMAECALLARHGDPAIAEERLAGVHRSGIYPREQWRVTLLRAYAAWRQGDASAGPLAARAFEEAARLGHPELPLIRERELTELLTALAVDTGSPAARSLGGSSLPVTLAVLGRFELARGGRPVAIGPGQAAQLLKVVAVSGGAVHAEQAIEALWPEADPPSGRNRLRTVLARLNQAVPEVVRREGELLVLDPRIRVDLAQFHEESRHALALQPANPGAALATARSAIARYRGDLLPHDLYEPWADEARGAARHVMLDLLGLCATAAAERGDLDEARRTVERALGLAPYDEDVYLDVARIFQDNGRRGAALSVLRRAHSVLAPHGIDVPLELPGAGKTVAA